MKKILIVDDDEDIRELIRELLESRFKVVTVSNGEEALRVFAAETLDLMITDLVMPKMDGLQLMSKIKALHKSFPIILMSGASLNLEEKVKGAEADGFITKPFCQGGLYQICSQLLLG